MDHTYYMQQVLQEAQESINTWSFPFSVVVVDRRTWEIAHKDHDRVEEFTDPTAHAEVNAIRFLCKKLSRLSLENYIFYTSSEPCPTCLTACIKAHVPEIYFGADTESTASLPIKAIELASKSKKYPIKVTWGILADECLRQREDFFMQVHSSL